MSVHNYELNQIPDKISCRDAYFHDINKPCKPFDIERNQQKIKKEKG